MNKEDDSPETLQATVSVRKGGLKLLLGSMLKKNGFFRSGCARVSLLEDDHQLYIEIPTNAGTAESYSHLTLSIVVPLPPDASRRTRDEPEDNSTEESSADVVGGGGPVNGGGVP